MFFSISFNNNKQKGFCSFLMENFNKIFNFY
jgi:hypothetical protein